MVWGKKLLRGCVSLTTEILFYPQMVPITSVNANKVHCNYSVKHVES